MKAFISTIVKSWNKFWFEPQQDTLYSLSAFRLAFGLTMFFFYLTRMWDVAFYYTDAGILPRAFGQAMEMNKYHYSPLFFTDNLALIQGLHVLFLVSLFSLTIGYHTRLSAILAYILHMSFINRNPTVMFGVDMISTFFFLYAMFAQLGAHYSVDAWLKKGKKVYTQTATSHIAWRLMQIQVCIVYGFSGIEKCKGTRWWDGSAIWDTLSMGTMQRWDLSFVAHYPIVLAASTYLVLFWEIYFPIMIWNKSIKKYVLWGGVLLHLQIGILMNLPSFAAMMMSYYFLFIESEAIKAFMQKWLPRLNPKLIYKSF
jgi:hypothetical protein